MTAAPFQARDGDPLTVALPQKHASHEQQHAFQNQPEAIHKDPTKASNVTTLQSPQLHHKSPPKRRYPILISFLNGRPIPHPLRLPPPQAPILKPHQKVCLPPLRAQPAIIANVAEAEICRGDSLREDVVHAKTGENLKRVPVAVKRFSRWLVDEDRVLANAYRKFGNDWRAISKLLPGRSPLAVKTRFHGKIRGHFRFNFGGANLGRV